MTTTAKDSLAKIERFHKFFAAYVRTNMLNGFNEADAAQLARTELFVRIANDERQAENSAEATIGLRDNEIKKLKEQIARQQKMIADLEAFIG
jgi:hypothetical protein